MQNKFKNSISQNLYFIFSSTANYYLWSFNKKVLHAAQFIILIVVIRRYLDITKEDLKRLKLIDNISGLQLFQLMKPIIFLIVSIVFTKSHLTRAEIGQWEMFMFIASLMTFFWVTGIVQSLLPLYHRNKTYNKVGESAPAKTPEIFNAFLLLCFFSLLFFILGHSLKNNFSVFNITGNVPYLNLLLLYILLSSPVCLIEYIYLLNNRSYRIFQYGLYTFSWTAHSYYFTDFIWKGYYLVHLGFTVNNRDQMDLAYNFA